MARSQEKINYFISLFLLCVVVFFISLKGTRLTSIDACIRASIARSVIETGSWYPPLYENKVLVDHPPLYTWSIAESFKWFGINDFAADLVGRIYALGSVLFVYGIGLLFQLPVFYAFLSAFIFLFTRDFILITIRGGIEPAFIFFSLMSWFFLILGHQKKSALQKSYLIFSGISVVLCAFTKGPPALWPLIFSLMYSVLQDLKNKQFKTIYPILGILFGVSLWTKWVLNSHTESYWLRYWNEQVLGSALKGRGNPENHWLYYFQILGLTYWPWLPFYIVSIFYSFKNLVKTFSLSRIIEKYSNAYPDGLLNLSILYSFGFLFGFTIVKWKLSYYIVPLFAGSALSIGSFLYLFRKKYFQRIQFSFDLSKWISGFCSIIILIFYMTGFKSQTDRLVEFSELKPFLINKKEPIVFYKNSNDLNEYSTQSFWHFNKVLENRLPKAGDFVLTNPTSSFECQIETLKICSEFKLIKMTAKTSLFYIQ